MPIIFPATHPSTPAFSRLTWGPVAFVALSETPTSGSQQVLEHPGQRLSLGVTLPPMPRALADPWIAFFLSLNGMSRQFLLGDSSAKIPLGSAGGNPGVSGLHTLVANSLSTYGWPISQSGVLLPGDFIQVGHNYLIDTAAFNTATWTKNQCTSSTNTIIAPNGVTEAERVTPDGGATDALIRQEVSTGVPGIPNRTFTGRSWLKAASGTPSIDILLKNQAAVTRASKSITLSTTWAEYFVNGAMAAGDTAVRFYIGGNSTWVIAEGAIDMWGASLDDELTKQRLHKVLEPVDTDADGNASITVWPNLRVPIEDHSRIFTSNTRGVFRLASNVMPWTVDTAKIYGIGFQAIEAI